MYIIKGWLDFDVLGPSWQKIPLNKRKCETSGDSVLRRTGLGTHGSSDDVLLMTSAWCKTLLPLQYTLQGPMLGSGKYTQSSVYKTHTMAESRSEVVKVMFILSQNVGTITLFTEYTRSHCVLEWDNEFLAAPGLLIVILLQRREAKDISRLWGGQVSKNFYEVWQYSPKSII